MKTGAVLPSSMVPAPSHGYCSVRGYKQTKWCIGSPTNSPGCEPEQIKSVMLYKYYRDWQGWNYYLHFIVRETEALCVKSLTRHTQAEPWGLPEGRAFQRRSGASCLSGISQQYAAVSSPPPVTKSMLCLLQAQEAAGT